MEWFDDPNITRRLPLLYRGYARYMRRAFNRSTSIARGGSFLLSLLIFLTKTLRLTSQAAVRLGDSTVVVDLCDHRMLLVFKEILSPSHESRIITSSLKPGDTFLDIGANHGSYALIAATAVGPSGAVAAFEPQRRLASLIRQSFRANRFANCTVHEMACSDREGVTAFYIPASGSGSGGLFKTYSALSSHERISVRTARLDDAIDWQSMPGRMFIKLDVEGSELEVLKGAAALIANRRPIILLEINPTSAGAAGYAVTDLLDLLGRFGYDRFSEVDRFPAAITRQEVDCTRQRNLVALPGQ